MSHTSPVSKHASVSGCLPRLQLLGSRKLPGSRVPDKAAEQLLWCTRPHEVYFTSTGKVPTAMIVLRCLQEALALDKVVTAADQARREKPAPRHRLILGDVAASGGSAKLLRARGVLTSMQ
jgi:hypothetical protein